ncbi:FAD dependent oxidoreductase [Bradyrhizobium sp. Rc2d]|nr:FAD dependent oxidoreductase [Bradyrhizobium sp. Rc2d]
MEGDPTSHGLWELTAPPAPRTGSLAGRLDADVVVIGGGYTGVSSALYLAEAGARVAFLEASDIGYGGSGRNVGRECGYVGNRRSHENAWANFGELLQQIRHSFWGLSRLGPAPRYRTHRIVPD